MVEVFCFFFPWVFPSFPALEGKDGAQLLPQQSPAGPTAWVFQDLDVSGLFLIIAYSRFLARFPLFILKCKKKKKKS